MKNVHVRRAKILRYNSGCALKLASPMPVKGSRKYLEIENQFSEALKDRTLIIIFFKGLLSFWTSSIVRYSNKHVYGISLFSSSRERVGDTYSVGKSSD
jgi:hypothetical protein